MTRPKTIKRVYHTWEKWECYPAGFYELKHPTKNDEDCREEYADFLRDLPAFEEALAAIVTEWKFSCEHYLSNENMNRIAWLGQASMCYARGVPAVYRGGFNRLSDDEQSAANEMALKYLNVWLDRAGYPPLTMDQAQSRTEMNLY